MSKPRIIQMTQGGACLYVLYDNGEVFWTAVSLNTEPKWFPLALPVTVQEQTELDILAAEKERIDAANREYWRAVGGCVECRTVTARCRCPTRSGVYR
jgi:hypothetical protein